MFPFTRKPRPDEQDGRTLNEADAGDRPTEAAPVAAEAAPADPLRRRDLTSPGLHGVAERILLGSATVGRVMGLLATIVALAVAVYFGYRHWVGFRRAAQALVR